MKFGIALVIRRLFSQPCNWAKQGWSFDWHAIRWGRRKRQWGWYKREGWRGIMLGGCRNYFSQSHPKWKEEHPRQIFDNFDQTPKSALLQTWVNRFIIWTFPGQTDSMNRIKCVFCIILLGTSDKMKHTRMTLWSGVSLFAVPDAVNTGPEWCRLAFTTANMLLMAQISKITLKWSCVIAVLCSIFCRKYHCNCSNFTVYSRHIKRSPLHTNIPALTFPPHHLLKSMSCAHTPTQTIMHHIKYYASGLC